MRHQIDIATMVGKMEQYINAGDFPDIPAHNMGLIPFILECRFIGLRLPRVSGKTSFLLRKFAQSHSMLLARDSWSVHVLKSQIRSELLSYIKICDIHTPQALEQEFLGKPPRMLKYLLIDEEVVWDDLIGGLNALQRLRMIDSDLTVIQLQT